MRVNYLSIKPGAKALGYFNRSNYNMSDILGERERLRPYDYEIFAKAHRAVMTSPWSPYEVSMEGDVLNWQNISETERKIIGGILKGFTLIELGVGCYWREFVAKTFKLPEIVQMATSFSHQETIHAIAYDYLESSLGLDTYEAFKQDEIAVKKLEDILNSRDDSNIGRNLAIFSGGVEGVSLYASFAVLISFVKKGLFKGMANQILSWSVLDEKLHSAMGIELYHQLITEYPELKPEDAELQSAFEMIAQNEYAFLQDAFGDADSIPTISFNEATDFVRYRTNKKLMELKVPPIYELTGDYLSVKDFFDTTIDSKMQNDFFAVMRNGGGYSAMMSKSFAGCNYTRG